MKMRITKAALKGDVRLQAPTKSKGQEIVWDDAREGGIMGFGVLLSGITAARSYVVQYGKMPRRTLARVQDLPLDLAQEEARKFLYMMRKGEDPVVKDSTQTVQALLDRYLEVKHLRPDSVRSMRNRITRHCKKWLDKPLSSITKEQAVKLHRDLPLKIQEQTDYPGFTIADALLINLRSLWNFAAEEGAVKGDNPFIIKSKYKSQGKIQPRRRIVELDQIGAWYREIQKLDNPVAVAFLSFLLFSGVRGKNARELEWKECDMDRKLIKIPGAKMKNRKEFVLPMNKPIYQLLKEMEKVQVNKFVFWANKSKTGHLKASDYWLRLVGEACGTTVCAHDIRRTAVHYMRRAHVDGLVARMLVAHKAELDVHDTYDKVGLDELRAESEKYAKYVMSAINAPPEGSNVVPIRAQN